jgi:hypothetical protein
VNAQRGELGLVAGGLGQSELSPLSIGPKLFYPVHLPNRVFGLSNRAYKVVSWMIVNDSY